MVRVVVTPGMNQQRAASYIGNFQPGCHYWIVYIPLGVQVERGQVTEMSVAPKHPVALACSRVVMPCLRLGRYHLPVLLFGTARRVFMYMKTMQGCAAGSWRAAQGGPHPEGGCRPERLL
jgi:hypothetical protein